jgi:Protein of unknown function (DUF4058)
MIQSPFPGMDPYLEAPNVWPDVRTRLMNIIAEQLTPLLVPKYLAELETQMVIDRLDADLHIVLPDVSVTTADVSAGTASAVAIAAPAPVRVRVPLDVPTRLVSVYIRERYTASIAATSMPTSSSRRSASIRSNGGPAFGSYSRQHQTGQGYDLQAIVLD